MYSRVRIIVKRNRITPNKTEIIVYINERSGGRFIFDSIFQNKCILWRLLSEKNMFFKRTKIHQTTVL